MNNESKNHALTPVGSQPSGQETAPQERGGCGKCENCSCKPMAAPLDMATPHAIPANVTPANLVPITTVATN